MPHPSHVKNQIANHPPKGSRITTDPIRTISDIEAIKRLLKPKPRDYLLFIMGINSGLRAGDLLQLRVGPFKNAQVDVKIPLREQKRGKHREIVVNESIKEALGYYFSHFKPGDDEFLFKSRKGNGPLGVSAVNLLVKGWCKAAGLIGNYGSHTLRKTFGTIARTVYGTPWEIISKVYNHSSPRTTLAYLGIQDDDVNEVFRQCSI